jgi:hypothetical protein
MVGRNGPSHWGKRTVLAVRQHDRRAGPAADELPGIALEIDSGGPLTGRSWPRHTIVLALERDAVALLLVRSGSRLFFGLRQRRGGGIVANALDTALARTREVIADLADIGFSVNLRLTRCLMRALGIRPFGENVTRGSSRKCALRRRYPHQALLNVWRNVRTSADRRALVFTPRPDRSAGAERLAPSGISST